MMVRVPVFNTWLVHMWCRVYQIFSECSPYRDVPTLTGVLTTMTTVTNIFVWTHAHASFPSLSSRRLFRNDANRGNPGSPAFIHHLDHLIVAQAAVGFQKDRLVTSCGVDRRQPRG